MSQRPSSFSLASRIANSFVLETVSFSLGVSQNARIDGTASAGIAENLEEPAQISDTLYPRK